MIMIIIVITIIIILLIIMIIMIITTRVPSCKLHESETYHAKSNQ